MKKLIALLFFCLFTLPAFAQVPALPGTIPPPPDITPPPPPDLSSPTSGGGGAGGNLVLLPIQSIAITKAHLENEVASAFFALHSPSMVPGGRNEVRVQRVSGHGAALTHINSTRLDFEVSNPHDPVTASGTLWGESGLQLFRLYKETRLAEYQNLPGIWWMRGESFKFSLVDPVPIRYPGVQEARIVVRNDEGEVIAARWLETGNGHFFMPTNFLERPGEVNVLYRRPDGTQRNESYSLSDGSPHQISSVSGHVPVAMEGDYYFGENPENIRLFGVDLRSALIRFYTRGKTSWRVEVGGRDQSGAVPRGFWVRLDGVGNNTNWSFVSEEQYRADGKWTFGEAAWQVVYAMDLQDTPFGGERGSEP